MTDMAPLDREAEGVVRDLPTLVPLKVAAAFLHVHVRTLQRAIRDQRLAAMRTAPRGSGRTLILKSELARFVNSMRQALPPAGSHPQESSRA